MKINNFVPDTKVFDVFGSEKSNVGKNDDTGIAFGNFLKEKLDVVNEKQIQGDSITESFIKGDEVNVHKVMIDNEEAKLSLELAVQVRNKLVEAYQELNRMQL